MVQDLYLEHVLEFQNQCSKYMSGTIYTYIYIYLRAAAPAADPGSKYGGLATFGYLLKQGNLGTNLRNISIAPCES